MDRAVTGLNDGTSCLPKELRDQTGGLPGREDCGAGLQRRGEMKLEEEKEEGGHETRVLSLIT